MKIAIAGATGLIGSELAVALRRRGDQVTVLTRRQARTEGEYHWDPARGTIDDQALAGCDAVVNLAGENIGAHRWTPSQRDRIVSSRVAATTLLAERIARSPAPVSALINASAIGIYGDRGDQVLTEASEPGEGFLAGVCVKWEEATRVASDAGARVVLLRTGVVLSAEGGALAKQVPLFRRGLGGTLGRGDQYLSWVSIADMVGAIIHLVDGTSTEGTFNIVSPAPVTNRVFTAELARVIGRPARLGVPGALLKLALGGQMASELLLASQRVVPEGLKSSGYVFADSDLGTALEGILARG